MVRVLASGVVGPGFPSPSGQIRLYHYITDGDGNPGSDVVLLSNVY
jgi:hypothetical protein